MMNNGFCFIYLIINKMIKESCASYHKQYCGKCRFHLIVIHWPETNNRWAWNLSVESLALYIHSLGRRGVIKWCVYVQRKCLAAAATPEFMHKHKLQTCRAMMWVSTCVKSSILNIIDTTATGHHHIYAKSA